MANIKVSDLSGKPGTEESPVGTFAFTWNDTPYEIDLLPAEAEKEFGRLANAARKVETAASTAKRSGSKSKSGSKSADPHNAEVRAWAKAQGIDVSERGRMAAEVHGKYNAAHAASPAA